MGKFLLYTITGSAIWNTVLVVLGSIVGENWTNILNIFDQYSNIVLVLLVIAFVVFVFWFYHNKMKKKDNSEEIAESPEATNTLTSDDKIESENANQSKEDAPKKISKTKKKVSKKSKNSEK